MTKIKQIVKDPSFKYFIAGLVMFLVLVGGGITLIKKLVNDKKTAQEAEIIAQEETKKPQGAIIIEDEKTDSENKESETAPEVVTVAPQAPEEISKTGGNVLIQAFSLGGLVYVAVLLAQKRQ